MVSQTLLSRIDKKRLPRHIALIMDGNGRWAKRRYLPRLVGHRAGVKVVDRIVTQCCKLGINALTLYAFSQENWNRPQKEIKILMGILKEYLKKELPRMIAEEIRFNTIGETDAFSSDIQSVLQEVKEKTGRGQKMILTLALNYGAQQEIVQVTKTIAARVKQGEFTLSQIDLSLFEDCLYTRGLPPLDLLIRTSGELRLSNFLLWQAAYTELYFVDKFWPDFKEDDLLKAIIDYQKRERRYGLTAEQLSLKKE